jgi:hypothetical protein
LSSADDALEVEHPPAVAAAAVRVQLVVVFMEAGDGAEVDHGPSVPPKLAHQVSLQ